MKSNIVILAIVSLLLGGLGTAALLFVLSGADPADFVANVTPRTHSNAGASESLPSTPISATANDRSRPVTRSPSESDRTPGADSDSNTIAYLQDELQELRSLNEQLRTQLTEVFNWILTNFKGKRPLNEAHLSKLALSPVTETFTLHPEVAEFLHVTPEEEAMINDALGYASAIIADIEEANLTLTNPQTGKVILHIPTFEEEGAVLREELYGALEATLGVNRFDTFLDVGQDGLEDSFHRFGGGSRTIIFELQPSIDEGYPQVVVKDGWVVQDDENRRFIQVTESTLDSFPVEYAEYLQHLPDDMKLPITISAE